MVVDGGLGDRRLSEIGLESGAIALSEYIYALNSNNNLLKTFYENFKTL